VTINNILRVSKSLTLGGKGERVPNEREVDHYDPSKTVGRSEQVKGSPQNSYFKKYYQVSQISPPNQ
jgi:hypothetical protein